MPVRCSNQLSYEATDVENWSFVGSDVPMMMSLFVMGPWSVTRGGHKLKLLALL